jgi:uncharacterized protein YciW
VRSIQGARITEPLRAPQNQNHTLKEETMLTMLSIAVWAVACLAGYYAIRWATTPTVEQIERLDLSDPAEQRRIARTYAWARALPELVLIFAALGLAWLLFVLFV